MNLFLETIHGMYYMHIHFDFIDAVMGCSEFIKGATNIFSTWDLQKC
jgi:hypothetical protein